MQRKNFNTGFARCANCGSNNIQGEPLYLYEDEEDDFGYDENDDANIAVFCVSCGHYLGETHSDLFEKAQNLRNSLLSRGYHVE